MFMMTGTGIGVLIKKDREELQKSLEDGGYEGKKSGCSFAFCKNRPLFEITNVAGGQNIYLCDKDLEMIVEQGKELLERFRKGELDSFLF